MFWNEVDGDDEEFNRIFGYGAWKLLMAQIGQRSAS